VEAVDRPQTLRLEQAILARNQEWARRNREFLRARGCLAINLMSSPGAGKTTLVEASLRELGGRLPLVVVEGDQAGRLDAERILAAGAPCVQIHTGTGCHLDASMVHRALHELDPPRGSLVLVENVGNLVCPALFDLGEEARVVLASVPEGDDKPLKYPHMFATADLALLNKVDLLPYVRFDTDAFWKAAGRVRPGLTILPISATRGDGLKDWCRWLLERARQSEGRA
jgi:hydrogenase nickel incorporation protein HypB